MSGTAGIQFPLVITFTQSVAGAANNNYVLTRQMNLTNAWVQARATQVAGTCQLFRQALGVGGYTAATDAINAGVDTAVTNVGILVAAQTAFVATDVIRFATVGAATLVTATAVFIPPVANSTVIP